MKTITIVIPTFNEESNVMEVYRRVKAIFTDELSNYRMNIQFVDNYSTDKTRLLIAQLCKEDKDVCAIFNAKNFGYTRSLFFGLTQATGDCAILLNADMQDPPEVIPSFVAEWEKGAKIVAGIKKKSKENPILYLLRGSYYRLIRHISEIDHIDQFDGFGLYDQSFVEVLRGMHDPLPYLRGIVAELGFQRVDVHYEQVRRKNGKTHFRFMSLYDLALLGITSYSKVIMHIATIVGMAVSLASAIVAVIVFIMKLIDWNHFPFGTAAIQVGIFFLGSMQLFFIGFVGEYIVNINARVMQHPLVVEERRLNFIDTSTMNESNLDKN